MGTPPAHRLLPSLRTGTISFALTSWFPGWSRGFSFDTKPQRVQEAGRFWDGYAIALRGMLRRCSKAPASRSSRWCAGVAKGPVVREWTT